MAKDDLDKIRSQHDEIIKNMADQSVRVAQYDMQKQSELASKNAMQAEMEKNRMAANTDTQKNTLDFAQKQAETDIKRAAISMKT